MANQSFTLFDDANEVFDIPSGSVTLLGVTDSEEPVKIKTPYMSRLVGEVVMWPYSQIPAGWAPCDGGTYNGFKTVDLRGRFPVCVGLNANPNSREADNTNYQLGSTGGINKYALNADEMPAHGHALNVEWTETDDGGIFPGKIPVANQNTKPWSTTSAGGGVAHENRPAYYALQFIQFIGLTPATA